MAVIGEGGWQTGSGFGSSLSNILSTEEIQPGSLPSYNICKELYATHPFGKKMVDTPIAMAQSQQREVEVPTGPGDRVKKAFLNKWQEVGADAILANLTRISRIYGIGTLAMIVLGEEPNAAVDFTKLYKRQIGFNVLDPLNTSGSTVLNQDPNDINFQKTAVVTVAGKSYHPSRTCVLLNEAPLYIAYTSSSFGYTGRSVYQRALYPLKSFVQSMRTDDLITRKAGVIIAKVKQVGSIIDNVISNILSMKRQIVKESITDDVISIAETDSIESLNLQNLDAPYLLARKNIIENLALSADMPAIILNSESFAEGFGEGTEDAKNVARYVEGIRGAMRPAYEFMDGIVQYLAWTPDFYATIQAEFDEYKGKDFTTAFYEWRNAFTAEFPSLLIEPDSEKIKVDEVRFKTVLAAAQIMMPEVDPANKATILSWMADTVNSQKLLFPVPLELDGQAILDFLESKQEQADAMGHQALEAGAGGDQEPTPPKPFGAEA
jgi:hypothetical protein